MVEKWLADVMPFLAAGSGRLFNRVIKYLVSRIMICYLAVKARRGATWSG